MIIPISPWLIIMLLLCLVGAVYGIVQNITSILVVVVAIMVLIFFLFKWPAKTVIILICSVVVMLIGGSISSLLERNSTPVTIYRAVADCIIYDERDNLVEVPSGAIVAKYNDPERISEEDNMYNVHSSMCEWFYEGRVYSSTVSIRHELSTWIEKYGFARNNWRLEEIEEINYKKFQQGNWWE